MFSLTEEFAKAQYDYTRERLRADVRPRVEKDERPARRRTGMFTHLFARHRLRPSLPDC
ncbi:hypothetical protein [Cryptosporangium aurantiacum]|uniref:Uncharacterized protein n=1 Tax=Cryptosporangium aurantiacum TaxID=134849 RepID=A0A1M7RBZ9_9ACTN|nr:hypothetical protein [Cryptosporangium aurantiacum]SHN43578.1 hypothetical protein SAMN05443668_109239 [Cryptosporangium aurantiacum]